MTPVWSLAGPRSRRCGGWFLMLVGVVMASPTVADDASPAVIRVRVPEGRVAAYFPPGTALRSLDPAEFNALAERAEAGERRRRANDPVRPVRVDHFARVDGETLAGRSLVPLPPTGDTPVIVACDPWSPALVASPAVAEFARVDATGRLILVQPAHQAGRVVELPWCQAALPASAGRGFALRLPEAAVATCTLDLAPGVRPTANAPGSALTRGPAPAPPDGLARWEFAGAAGRFPLFLDPPSPPEGDAGTTTPRLWVGGATRVDLATPGANWTADWTVERPDGAPATLRLELDPGLELVDVTGPDFAAARPGPPGRGDEPTWVEVDLRASESNRSRSVPLAIRGVTRAPLEGPWLVPSARVAGAAWLGGRTEVQLGPARVAIAVEPRAGRRVAPRPDEGGPHHLSFETDHRPGPVAEIRFGRPAVDASVEIRGTLRVGGFAPQAEVIATWRVDRDRVVDPVVDLPGGWAVRRVGAGAGQVPVRWRSEAIPGSPAWQRLHPDGVPWVSDTAGQSLTLTIAATRGEAATSGGADLIVAPRVRPASNSVRVADERWEAVAEPGWAIEPTATRELAWLDPARAEAANAAGSAAEGDPTRADRSATWGLAWRWMGEGGAATFRRREDRTRPHLDERVEATITRGRLRLAWSWTIAEVGRPASFPFAVEFPPEAAPRWRAVGAGGSRVLQPMTLDPDRRGRAGLSPGPSRAGAIALDPLPRGSVSIRGEVELPWAGSGVIPLCVLPDGVAARRSVVVRVEDGARFRVDRVEGLDPVGFVVRAGAATLGREDEPAPIRAIVGEAQPGFRVAGAWLGASGPPRLSVSTIEAPEPGDGAVVVTEASLRSRLSPGTEARHRLSLRIATGLGRAIDLTMPAGAVLDQVSRDGQPIIPVEHAGHLRFDLTTPTEPARPTTVIALDYRTEAASAGPGPVHPAAFLPATPAPCLSFTWQVNVPEAFDVLAGSRDLVPTDLAVLADGPPAPVTPRGRAGAGAEAAELAAESDLDATWAGGATAETTLGDWLVRLDAGRWPLIVDRLALGSGGWGPRSRVDLAGPESGRPDRPGRVAAAFRAIGLTIEPVGGVFLVSTAAEGRSSSAEPTGPARLPATFVRALSAAILAGSDGSDRYQTPARWRGEPTPRSWLASETPDLGLVVAGWRAHRFAAARWPAPSAAISIHDGRESWRRAGLGLAGGVGLVVALRRATWLRLVWSWARRLVGRRIATMLLAAAVVTAGARGPAAEPDPGGPIVVLLPYANLAEVEAPPARVLIRDEDHDRLLRQAQAAEPALGGATRLAAVTHQIGAPSGQGVAVVSRYTLEVGGEGPGSWTIPVGTSFDLAAMLDDRPVPLAIDPSGRTATLRALPAGKSEVTVRRMVPIVPAAGGGKVGGSVVVSVAPAAFSRVEVAAGSGVDRVRLDGTARRADLGPAGLVAELGPADRFSARWGEAEVVEPPGDVEVAAAVRWDVGAAGDRVVARLTVAGRRPLRMIQLGLESGLAVVGATVPGLVGSFAGPGQGGESWTALVDRPLEPGTSFDLTLWRPAPPAASPRVAPRWDLHGARTAGWIGCRRPEDWAGRLDQAGDEAAPGDAEFFRTWDPARPDGMVSAGVARWNDGRRLIAAVGPPLVEWVTRTEVGVEVAPGRLGFIAESRLTARQGIGWDAEARFDGPVRIARVDAAGLASWIQPEPDRVRLTFDGSAPPRERLVRLHGSGVDASPAGEEPGSPRAAVVPWPRWADATDEAGRLVVAGGEGVLVRAGDRAISAEGGDQPAGARQGRRAYPARADLGPLHLAWTNPAPRADIAVRSDVRIDPARVRWTARVVASAVGGPIRKLHWRIPTAWAAGATLTAPAEAPQPRVEVEIRDDTTLWTIEADRPVWGRWELTLWSSRATEPAIGFDYPQVSPLASPGQGTITGYSLTLTNLAGRPIAVENESGLIALTALRARSALSEVPGGIVSRAYRVAGEPWSLRVGAGPTLEAARGEPEVGFEPEGPAGRFDDSGSSVRVERADLRLAVDSAGRIEGRGECLVERRGRFLTVVLPVTARLGGVSVEGRPVAPVAPAGPGAGGLGRWLVPLGDQAPRRVMFQWSGVASDAGVEAGPRKIGLPGFDQPAVPTSLCVATTAGGGEPVMAGGRWTRLDPLAASLARFERWDQQVEWQARRAPAEPSSADLAAVVEPLAAMTLELRAVERSLRTAGRFPQPSIAGWRAIQARAEATVTAAGLRDCLDQARERAGLGAGRPSTDPDASVEPQDQFRIRQVGRLLDFRGMTATDPAVPTRLILPD